MKFDLKGCFIACNRSIDAADWSDDTYCVYAAGHFIAVYDPLRKDKRGTLYTLKGHSDQVNSVKVLKRGTGTNQKVVGFVSSSADKTARIWRKVNQEWKCTAVLKGHQDNIVCLGVMRGKEIDETEQHDIIATGSVDGKIRIWTTKFNDHDMEEYPECTQIIDSKNGQFPLALALSYMPNTLVPVLFVGTVKNEIDVYLKEKFLDNVSEKQEFLKVLSLQGHTDWIRNIEVATFTSYGNTNVSGYQDGDLMIVSSSQDKYIRIWKISSLNNPVVDENTLLGNARLVAAHEKRNADLNSSELTSEMLEQLMNANENGVKLSTKAHLVSVSVGHEEKRRFTVMFDALLMGHEDWVHSAKFAPAIIKENHFVQPLKIVSASADKSIMIWTPDQYDHVWINKVRVGELGGESFGYYGACFSPRNDVILAHSYNGSIQIWATEQHRHSENSNEDNKEEWIYKPVIGISGHFDSVEDLAWDTTGTFLTSVSLDETTRLFAPWSPMEPERDNRQNLTWHEIARPQIHGFGIHCLAFFNNFGFVSGADEKVIRVFECPSTLRKSIEKTTKVKLVESEKENELLPIGATLPALGLTNKAVYKGDLKEVEESHDTRHFASYTSVSSTATSFTDILGSPPLEGHLMQHTLWPETDKLYAHGYEMISITSSTNGKWVASASKATKPEHAVIRIWSTQTWKEACEPLSGHSLTVTTLQFSNNNQYLLSAGRDRNLCLFKLKTSSPNHSQVDEEEKIKFQKVFQDPKAHSRIIWDASWSHDDKFVVSASRDKSVKLWKLEEHYQVEGDESVVENSINITVVEMIKFDEGCTAVSFMPFMYSDRYVFLVGLETGDILLYQFKVNHDGIELEGPNKVSERDSHALSVNRLSWKNTKSFQKDQENKEEPFIFASCSSDHSVRLFQVEF